ncbi:MAG: hypothetical protein AAGG44_16560, partial [Planctomycetota bacterium]
GVEMAIAVSMLLLLRSQVYQPALLIGGLPLIGSSVCRVVGCMVDGFSGLHIGMAALEFGGFLFCLSAYLRLETKDANRTT